MFAAATRNPNEKANACNNAYRVDGSPVTGPGAWAASSTEGKMTTNDNHTSGGNPMRVDPVDAEFVGHCDCGIELFAGESCETTIVGACGHEILVSHLEESEKHVVEALICADCAGEELYRLRRDTN